MCRAIHDHCRVLGVLLPSLRDFVRAFALASPGGAVFESGVTAAIVPAMPDRAVVNSVVYDDAGELEARLPDIAAAYDDAGVAKWTVWAHEDDARAARALEAFGNFLDSEPMAMGRGLEGVEAPDLGELELVSDPEPEAVADLLARVYGWENIAAALRWYDGYFPYLALLDGEPAVTLGIHDRGDDAHVTLVGTAEAARGRGFAGLLMCRALADARERGRTTTTLVATKMGHPVYARLGYRDYGRMRMWERPRPRDGDNDA